MATVLDALNLIHSEQQEKDEKGLPDAEACPEEKIAHLEKGIEALWKFTLILLEFCRSAANKEGMSLLSFQQLYSPSAHSCQKVRMLFKKIRESS